MSSLILDIPTYYVRGYCISHTPDKISITPEFSRPQLFSQPRKLFEYFSGRYAFHYLDHSGRRIPRRSLHKYVNMISNHFHRIYCKSILLSYPSKYLFDIVTNFSTQHGLSIFRYPYQMIFQFIYRMLRPSYYHNTVISSSPSSRQMLISRCFAAIHFHPPSKLAGIQWFFL